MNIVEAINDPNLYGPWFPGSTWGGWQSVLKGGFALPMTDDEHEFFRSVAQRDPPTRPSREWWICAGRRAGKDSVASVMATHIAATFEDQHRLRPGERALVACLAVDKDQAKIILNYTRSYFTDIPLLQGMVTRETATGFELNNGVDIAITTNSYRSARGRPILCAVHDECAFYRDEESANPDIELMRALEPGLASLPTSMVIGISTAYRKKGLLYSKFQKHFGRDDDSVLVIRAPTSALNPTIDPALIAKALENDPDSARAEWFGEFRADLEDFASVDAIRACVALGVRERRPDRKFSYCGFVDVSGGSADAMTLAIAHSEGDRQQRTAILDAVREVRPPFSPETVTQEFCDLLRSYRITKVVGDRYGGQWPVEVFKKFGVNYEASERTKSELYVDLLPLINSRAVDLLDHDRLVHQLSSLERRATRGGRDSIDHPPGSHDDLSNACAGALVRASQWRGAYADGAGSRSAPRVVLGYQAQKSSQWKHHQPTKMSSRSGNISIHQVRREIAEKYGEE